MRTYNQVPSRSSMILTGQPGLLDVVLHSISFVLEPKYLNASKWLIQPPHSNLPLLDAEPTDRYRGLDATARFCCGKVSLASTTPEERSKALVFEYAHIVPGVARRCFLTPVLSSGHECNFSRGLNLKFASRNGCRHDRGFTRSGNR
jgi:hypothetical protein